MVALTYLQQHQQTQRNLLNTFLLGIVVSLLLLSIVNTSYAADLIAGKTIYNRCIGCHSLTQNRTGPKHCGLFGRQAGSVQDYDYSAAMRDSTIVWDGDTLDAFIKAPLSYITGTNMGYAGIKNDIERADLIAYLKQASQAKECQ
jgi:cytochrome c